MMALDMRQALKLMAMGAALLGSAASASQENSKGDDRDESDDILVTGARQTREESRKAAVDFLRKTGAATTFKQVARWVEPVCPRAFGLSSEHATLVEAKVRAIAADAGAPVAPAECKANIAITFTMDGGRFVRTLSRRAPRQFTRVSPARMRELREGEEPVRWWYGDAIQAKGTSGSGDTPAPWTGGEGGGSGSALPLVDGAPSLNQYGSSLISTGAVRALVQATVVIDVSRVEGLPLDTVASYAAMVSLAEINALDDPPAQSILGLFGSGPNVQAVTQEDATFLSALYALPLDRLPRRQRGALIRAMTEDPGG